MQLILQNTKQLKQVRQFIKGLSYVYDSTDQKDKQIYLYISRAYIAIVNSFMKKSVPGYRVCFCRLRRNMYKLRNFGDWGGEGSGGGAGGNGGEGNGVIFYLDAQLILKLLNTQVEADITQMVMVFPDGQATGNKQYQMRMSYQADGLKAAFKIFTRLQPTQWPFTDSIPAQILPNSIICPFLTFPSKFVKQIEYYKKFPEFWITLSPEGINLKRTEGGYVMADQTLRKEQFGEYDYYALGEVLTGNINLCVDSEGFFRHLEQSNRENRKTQGKLLIEQEYYQEENIIKKCYLLLTTSTDKRQIHQFFQISARPLIDYSSAVRQVQRLKLRTKDTKKQQQAQDQRLVLNRFYGPEYEETVRMDQVIRGGFVRTEMGVEGTRVKYRDEQGGGKREGMGRERLKGQESVSNARKYKIQLE